MSRRRKRWRPSSGPVCTECGVVRPRVGIVCSKCRGKDREPVYRTPPPMPASPTPPVVQARSAAVRTPPSKNNGGLVWLCIIAVVLLVGWASASKPASRSYAQTSTATRPANWTPSPVDAPKPRDYSTNRFYDPPNLPNGDVGVRGYYRKDGTYVRPHHRTRANSSQSDNYSYRGNVNPYTRKRGSHR